MKITIALLSFFFSISLFSNAQEEPKIKFGKVSEEELKMSVYASDTSATALILYDDGKSEVAYDNSTDRFILTSDRVVRIKILKERGKKYADINLSLYSFNQTKEELRGIDGVTFNLENGKMVKTELKKDGIFRERENKYWESVKISLPAVKVGSVIDLKYTVFSPLLWNLQPWTFQYSIPVKWSHFYVEYPEYFSYNQSTRGYHPLTSTKTGTKSESINYTETYQTKAGLQGMTGSINERVSRSIPYIASTFDYIGKDVPAIKEEPYSTTMDNFTTRVVFELAQTDFTKIGGDFKNYTNTWESIAEDLDKDEDFGGQINGGNFVEDEVKKITTGLTDDMQKLTALYSYVQKNIKWDKYRGYQTSQTLKKTFNDKTGNTADINLLLLVMLQKAKITAHPVILSTRDNGIIHPAHPTLSECNYVVVKATIGDKPVFLDATDPLIPAGQLPLGCMNGNGFAIFKGTAEETPISTVKTQSSMSVMLELKDGKLLGSATSRISGQEAYNFRSDIKDAGGKKEYFEKLKNKTKEIEYLDFKYSNVDSLYSPLDKTYNFSLNEGLSEDNSIIYLDPVLFGKITENPFTAPTRTYPIDFGVASLDNYTINFSIPEGYKVEELPKSKNMILGENDGKFTYTVGQVDNRIMVKIRFSIDKTIFLPEEYPTLKEFFDKVVANEAEQIVLKKI